MTCEGMIRLHILISRSRHSVNQMRDIPQCYIQVFRNLPRLHSHIESPLRITYWKVIIPLRVSTRLNAPSLLNCALQRGHTYGVIGVHLRPSRCWFPSSSRELKLTRSFSLICLSLAQFSQGPNPDATRQSTYLHRKLWHSDLGATRWSSCIYSSPAFLNSWLKPLMSKAPFQKYIRCLASILCPWQNVGDLHSL